MVSESELKSIRQFVRGQLRAEQDLSSLTLGILKRRYLAKLGSDVLSASAKSLLKQAVEQELIEMQESKSDESEAEDVQNKRKRERENDIASESENEVASKRIKSSCRVSSESESEDEESNAAESVGDEEEEQSKTGSGGEKQEIRKSPEKRNGKCEEDSEDGETEMETNMAKKKTRQSSDDDDDDESNSKKNDSSQSSDESEKEENVAEKTTNHADSDSSSLPSLEDEQELQTKENKVKQKKEKDQDGGKRKSSKKDKDGPAKKQKEDDKAVVRLKRYISLCGERRNYKKLLGECRSVRSMLAVLKKELEDLGVHGQPSIKKCKKVRLKKEEARELAELDVSNIIDSQGRPKRRGAFAQQRESARHALPRPPSSVSDSEEENDVRQVQRRTSNWANLQGIISDDADSD